MSTITKTIGFLWAFRQFSDHDVKNHPKKEANRTLSARRSPVCFRSMKVLFPILGAFILTLQSAGGCHAATIAPEEESTSLSPLSAEQYLVSPKDVLQITIVGENDLPVQFPVGESGGTIKFPYIQYVEVTGLTVKWIEKLITALLQGADPVELDKAMEELRRGGDAKKVQKRVDELLQEVEANDCWYRDPQVNVMVAKYSEKFFYVEGYVAKSGQYAFTGENMMTVYRAITRAGGFKPDAKKTVRLITHDVDGNTQTVEVDVSAIIKKNAPDPPIQANDVIRVDQSFW
jgi:protein involved in polysaccharide export with SLBB domain